MADNPSSDALPPSPLIVATINTDIKDVSMPETAMKNRQEMSNSILNDNAHDKKINCDGKTKLSRTCSAVVHPLFSLFAAHNNIIKGVHITENSSRNGQKLSSKIIPDVYIQDQDNSMQSNNNTSLADAPWISRQQSLWLDQVLPIKFLNGGIKSKDDCGLGNCTLMEMGKKLANSDRKSVV